MSIAQPKNEFTEDLLACRACLATNSELHSIHQDQLSDAYKNLMGIEVSPCDSLPQYFCKVCANLLKEYSAFRDHCQKARLYLEDAQMRDEIITISYLNNFQQYLKHKTTNTLIITPDKNNTVNDEHLPNDQFDNYDDIYHQHTYSPTENCQYDLKIYTDIVKIETQETEITKVKQLEPNKNDKRKKFSQLRQISENENIKTKGKYFETKDNMRDFEKAYDVDIVVLSREQQMKDVSERKLSFNYLHSPYKCELCYKGYIAADTYNKHVQSQHDPSRGDVVCEFCRFRYKDRRGLTQHLRSHRLKFTCKQCPYVSRTTFNAKEHFKMHSGQMHSCRHCGKSYEKLSSHLTHLRIHHPSEFVWCDVCGEAFIGTFGLNVHKKIAHRHLSLPAPCTSCDKRFADAAALERHNISRDNCSGYPCLHCGQAFTVALELRDHLFEKHRACKIYTCEKCSKTFSRESLYSAHYRRIHVDPEQKDPRKKTPWICEVCGKELPNKCVLRYHQRNHTGEKPYHCTECPKSFTMKKLLQSHLRVHTSDRPFTCKLCPKTFKGLSALRGHEHIHTDGKSKVASKNTKI